MLDIQHFGPHLAPAVGDGFKIYRRMHLRFPFMFSSTGSLALILLSGRTDRRQPQRGQQRCPGQ
jgi:hypothetical protein